MTKERYSIAFSELIYIINNMSKTNREKIPEEFITFLEENKDKNYVPENISLSNKESLKRETKILIAIMYRDYFMSEKERNKKELEDKLTLEKIYSYDNMFGQGNETEKDKDEDTNVNNETIQIENVDISEKSLVELKEENKVIVIVNLIKEKINKFINRFINRK